MDGFQVRCSFMIAVEAAAGVVFARLGLQLWVRRDGLSSNFLRRIDFPSSVLLHWAKGVFVEVFYVLSYFRPIVISMGEGGANTSCPGRLRS